MIKEKWQVPLFVALLIFALLISTQYRTQATYLGSLSSQNSNDLVTIVKSLNGKRISLEVELNDLSKTKRALDNQVLSGTSMKESLTNELHQLQLLNGTTPVHGPGITVTITDDSNIDYHNIIDLINELWASGAEAVAINDIRFSANTEIFQTEDANHRLKITLNGKPLLMPMVIKAIGSSDTLEKGLTFPGGIIDNLNIYQVYPTTKKQDRIIIPASL